ncbi:MAG: hypothetical protein ACU0E9_00720 [Limimaricola soesokkakensis]|uniref:hypothetical protein n=1 Tax=Limimaricola soesokkakensis TaxID=1343159 RepID=UPI004058D7DE
MDDRDSARLAHTVRPVGRLWIILIIVTLQTVITRKPQADLPGPAAPRNPAAPQQGRFVDGLFQLPVAAATAIRMRN